MKIPDESYSRVFDLVTLITNASEADDNREYWSRYNELREFCETEAIAGRGHPFLWETLADFTSENNLAVGLYMKGLEEAIGEDASMFRASIKFALAERHLELGNTQSAVQYAHEANEEAKALDDLDLRKDISEFLLRVTTHGPS